MKKHFAMIGIGVLLLSSCAGNHKKTDDDSLKLAALASQYEQATSFNDSLMLLMGDIYTGLDSINMQEGLLYNMKAGDSANRREEIRQNLSNIKARLEANRALIAKMEAQIKASGNDNSVQAKTIAQLKAHIEQQDKKIAQLESDLANARGQIEELNTQVAETQEQVKVETAAKEEAQKATVAAENEANRVYYAIGTGKELKANGLLEKKFLGTTKVMKGSYNEAYFTTADKRTLTLIPTGAKKIKIWSNNPQGSYEIVDNADGTKTVKITNPTAFWSITPYLIIQVN